VLFLHNKYVFLLIMCVMKLDKDIHTNA